MIENLTQRTVSGVTWTAVSQTLRQVLGLVIIAVLARKLLPSDFGIVGMATIITGLIGTVNELGMSAAIVQKKEIDDEHLSTSYWLAIIVGVVLFLLAVAVSPLVARFFNNALVKPVLIVSSTGFILGSSGIVHRAVLTRMLAFRELAYVEIGQTVVYGIVAIVMALNGFGVWSLVWGSLGGITGSVLLLWALSDWRPAFIFRGDKFSELFSFGANVAGFRFVNYLRENFDYLLIGRLLGASALGYYTLAYQLINLPRKKLSSIITRVTFPSFSRVQDDDQKIRRGYLKTVTAISLATFPLLFGLCFVAPEFVRVVYGQRWDPIILPLRILTVAGILYSIGTTVGSVILAKGRSDLQLKIGVSCLFILALFVITGARYGIVGVASAISIYSLLFVFAVQVVANRLIGLRMKDFIIALYPATISSVIMLISLLIGRFFVFDRFISGNFAVLFSSIMSGGIVYFLALKVLKFKAVTEVVDIISEMMIPPGWERIRKIASWVA